MRSESKAWVKAEQKQGQRAARLPIALGAALVLLAIFQAFCASQLLAAVLHLAPRGMHIVLYATGFALLAVIRACIQAQAERLGFERGASARRRLRNDVLSTLLAVGPAGLRTRHSAELAATAVDRVEAMEGFHARWIPAAALATIGPLLVVLAAFWSDWRSGLVLLIAG